MRQSNGFSFIQHILDANINPRIEALLGTSHLSLTPAA